MPNLVEKPPRVPCSYGRKVHEYVTANGCHETLKNVRMGRSVKYPD